MRAAHDCREFPARRQHLGGDVEFSGNPGQALLQHLELLLLRGVGPRGRKGAVMGTKVLGLIMAGGKGERLYPLTRDRVGLHPEVPPELS